MDTPNLATEPLAELSAFSAPNLAETLGRLRNAWSANLPTYQQRRDDLERLRLAVIKHKHALCEAVSADFGRRSRHETLIADVMMVLEDIKHSRSKLKSWMRVRRVPIDPKAWPARGRIYHQPIGVVGILSPWNYPIQLALAPLTAAIAAGNHVMLKPSEHTPRTSELLKQLLAEVFPADRVSVVLGGAELAAAFSALPFDHLLYTGSTAVGRMVMAAAAKNLTPVTLELGGKSPTLIAPEYPIEKAVARIVAMKHLNAGQTCIAPDYVFVPEHSVPAFVEAYRREIASAYPNLANNPDYSSIVSERQAQRLREYLTDARTQGAEVIEICPGTAPGLESQIVAPTLVLGATDAMKIMQEEIFGPILPVLTYSKLDDALDYIRQHARPLAFYHFDNEHKRTQYVLSRVVAGGVTVNDCALHITQHELPFGGVGASGMGHDHGPAGFLTFTKQMPVFFQARWSSFWLLKPPFNKLADWAVEFLTRK